MAFYAHRCLRPECKHPDYFSGASREQGSVTRGMTVDGQPANEWATREHEGRQMLRASCGSCPQCARGCDYDQEPFEVEQFQAGHYGMVDPRFYAPGNPVNKATRPAPMYACNCDACRHAYAFRQQQP